MRISLVVIAFNEVQRIQACLESVEGLVEEMVVVDSGSTDGTQALAASLGARVVFNAFEGHIEQKNFARMQAREAWVLSLDADERLDEEAKAAVYQLKKEGPKAEVYGWKRLNHYGLRPIKHGAWYPDKKWRLWKAGSGAWDGMNPHDAFVPLEGKKQVWLPGHVLHFSFSGPEAHWEKARRFARIAAEAYLKKGKKAGMASAMLHALARWFRDLVLLGGWKDGKAGFQIAWISAAEVYWKYLHLRHLMRNNSK